MPNTLCTCTLSLLCHSKVIKLLLFNWNSHQRFIKNARRSQSVYKYFGTFAVNSSAFAWSDFVKWVSILIICMCVRKVKKKCTPAAVAMDRRKSHYHYRHYEIYETHSNDPRVERHKPVWPPVHCKMIIAKRARQKSRVSTVQMNNEVYFCIELNRLRVIVQKQLRVSWIA